MSYEKVKYITRKPKEGKIFITSACSNVFPKTYYKWEFMEKETDYHKKELALIRGLNGGGLVLNNSCYEWNYALMKTNKELYGSENTWKIYEDSSIKYQQYCLGDLIGDTYTPITQEDLKSGKYEEDYKGKTYTLYRNIEEYKKSKEKAEKELERYYNVFIKFLEEKCEGKYYLYSKKYGYIKPKGMSGSFYYSQYNNAFTKGNVMDYKKAYCLAYNIGRDIEVKAVPTREYVPTKEQIKESKKRLELLGLQFDNSDSLYLSELWHTKEVKDSEFDLIEKINKFEKDYNCYVYHIIYSDTSFGEMYSMLYVSAYNSEWEQDIEDLTNGKAYAYVWNKSDDILSEIGLIGFEDSGYCLKRTF